MKGTGDVILEEGLYNKKFIERATEHFESYRKQVQLYTPEFAEEITGMIWSIPIC